MNILCVFGRYNYGDPARGEGYEYVHFLPALRCLGHEVAFFDSWNKALYRDFADLNRKLLETVRQKQPDVLLCVTMTCEIWLETLQLIREGSNTALLHWNPDDSWKYAQSSRLIAPAFDLMVTTYPSAMTSSAHDGLENFILSQWAANSETLQAPLPAKQCRYPVSCIGTAYGNRKQWVAQLKQRGIDVVCFGHGWPSGAVAAGDIPRIYRESVLSLNFGDSGVVIESGKPVRSRQIKARVFEVPGAGGLLLTEDAEHLDACYRLDEEIVVFGDIDDLTSKIKTLLADAGRRDTIAKAGYVRTSREHVYEMRFKPLLTEVQRRRDLRRGASGGIDFARFERLVRRHRVHSLLKLLRLLLSGPCMLLWGRDRGQRAARRLLFELSWRLLGSKTYTAGGWPGRLFYRES